MDYNYIFEKANNKAHFFIIKKFKAFYKEGRTFEYSIDTIRTSVYNLKKNHILNKNINLFEKAVSKFDLRGNYFRSSDVDIITKIINTEIIKEFNIIEETIRKGDSAYDGLNNYTFEKFNFDLIVYCNLKEIENRLGENSNLYRLFFDINTYKEFTLEHFEGKVEESELYKKLHKIAHPEIKADNKSNKVEESNLDIDPRFTLLNNDEKILLLHIIHKTFFKTKTEKGPKIDLTDFARVIYLTKDCVDPNIFDKNYSNKTFYKKLCEGNIYSDSLDKRKKLISSLSEKIDFLNLKSVSEHIESIKTITIKSNKK
jgi:hypothetical protein